MGTIDIYDHWQDFFANLTFKFIEVEVQSASLDLFFDFNVDPLGQTTDMNAPT